MAGDTEKMKELYEKNQNIELHVDRSGWNGLHHASAAGQIKDSLHSRRIRGIASAPRWRHDRLTHGFPKTAAHASPTVNLPKPVETMLTWNFDINAVTNENETPILLASRNGHKELTSVLLENGADPLISTKAKILKILKFLVL